MASGLPLSAALSSIVLRYLQSVKNALIDSDWMRNIRGSRHVHIEAWMLDDKYHNLIRKRLTKIVV